MPDVSVAKSSARSERSSRASTESYAILPGRNTRNYELDSLSHTTVYIAVVHHVVHLNPAPPRGSWWRCRSVGEGSRRSGLACTSSQHTPQGVDGEALLERAVVPHRVLEVVTRPSLHRHSGIRHSGIQSLVSPLSMLSRKE